MRWGGPSRALDTEARCEQARSLLHDTTVKPEERLAGLLVLLYAQWPAAISRLTVVHVHVIDGQVRIRLGDEPLVLPEPLASLALQVVASRRGKPPSANGAPRPGCWPSTRRVRPGRTTSPTRPASWPGPIDRVVPACYHLPPPCSPVCSASTSQSRSPGNAPAPGDWMAYAADISRQHRGGVPK